MQLIKPVVLFDIDYTLFDTDFFKESGLSEHRIYEEVISVLEKLSKIALLGIFSEGNIDFQIRKLKETNIEKYFAENNTHIVLNKLDELEGIFQRYENRKFFFVDDKLTILADAKKAFPDVFAIWVKRGPFAKAQKPIPGFNPDKEVKSLREIVSVINSKLKIEN